MGIFIFEYYDIEEILENDNTVPYIFNQDTIVLV
jgi:hypothetical protein